MNVLTHKRSVFHMAMLVVVMALALTGCGGDDAKELEYPVIRLQINDQTFSPPVYQYYWPKTADDVVYDIDYGAYTQTQNVPVAKDDTVHFTVDGSAGTPTVFTATLLDGTNTVQDLHVSNGAFNAQLPDGVYTVQVDARWNNVDGHEAYVIYVFGLNIAGVMPPTPTPTVTPTATFTPTYTPTVMPTGTPLPTATATEAPTVIPTAETGITADLGEQVITGTVRLSSNGTLITVAGAAVTYRHTSTEDHSRDSYGTVTTNASGQYEFAPMMVFGTDQVVIQASAPGYETQIIERSGLDVVNAQGVIDFVLLPGGDTATSLPKPTVTPIAVAPTSEPPPEPSATTVAATPPAIRPLTGVPYLTLAFAGQDYTPVGYRTCERSQTGESVCTEFPIEDASPTRIRLLRGAAAQLILDGPRPDSVRIEYLSDAGEQTGQPETRSGDTITLFTITPEPGSYIMAVRVTWAETDATYFFRVMVSD